MQIIPFQFRPKVTLREVLRKTSDCVHRLLINDVDLKIMILCWWSWWLRRRLILYNLSPKNPFFCINQVWLLVPHKLFFFCWLPRGAWINILKKMRSCHFIFRYHYHICQQMLTSLIQKNKRKKFTWSSWMTWVSSKRITLQRIDLRFFFLLFDPKHNMMTSDTKNIQ